MLPDRVQERAKAHRIGPQELVRLRLLGPRESTVFGFVPSAHSFYSLLVKFFTALFLNEV